MGLEFRQRVGSRLRFFRAGKTRARFCEGEMQPSRTDLLQRYRKKENSIRICLSVSNTPV